MILSSHGIIGSSIVQLTGVLLDDYPNAAAAYSLRKLRSAYTGSAIRVRIDTTGQPEYNIGFVNNELDVATLEGYCTGGLNAYVKTWYDQSGNGRDATQTTAANQPQIVSSGSVVLENSKSAIKYDGSLTKLFVSASTATFKFLSDGTASTVLGVAKLLNTSTDYIYGTLISTSGFSSATIGYQLGIENRSTQGSPNALRSTVFNGVSGNGIVLDNNTNTTGQNQQLYIDIVDADNSTVSLRSSHFINNNTVSRNNVANLVASTSDSTNNLYIGSFQTLNLPFITNGTIQELIIYSTDQTSNKTGIETNINTYYSIY